MLAQVEATGDTPLAYMIGVLQDESSPADARKWAAEKAAPYINAKPLPQARTITLELPDTATPLGIAEAIGAVLAATARGAIAASEGRDLVALLEARLKAFESVELEARIRQLEERMTP